MEATVVPRDLVCTGTSTRYHTHALILHVLVHKVLDKVKSKTDVHTLAFGSNLKAGTPCD